MVSSLIGRASDLFVSHPNSGLGLGAGPFPASAGKIARRKLCMKSDIGDSQSERKYRRSSTGFGIVSCYSRLFLASSFRLRRSVVLENESVCQRANLLPMELGKW